MKTKEQLKKAWTIYEDFILNVPYSSVSQLYKYLENMDVPMNLGVPCALQSFDLGVRFKNNGFKYWYIRDNRHGAVIVEIENVKYYFDPYLLHSEIIDISKIDGMGFVSFNAYPVRMSSDKKQIPSMLKVRYDSKNARLISIYNQFEPGENKYKLSRKFRFDMNFRAWNFPPPEEVIPLFFHPEQTTISMRVLCKSDRKLYNIIYPICWYHGDKKQDPQNIKLKLNDGEVIDFSSPRFKFYISKIATNVGVSDKELIDFIMGGVFTYEKHSPSKINFHKYELELSE